MLRDKRARAIADMKKKDRIIDEMNAELRQSIIEYERLCIEHERLSIENERIRTESSA